MFENKILLITGGTGSFGNAVIRRFLKTNIKEIRVFSRDEKKQDDMRKQIGDSKVSFYIGDVRDRQSIDYAMKGVDYVFHAAALKQVPSCEFYPLEAVKTNIQGTENVVDSAVKHKVKRLIGLSTDKAVYPINAMGISKSMMEKVITAKSRNLSDDETTLCVTRYGNVMASRGSVIPLFIEQLEKGNPITITDPKMTRFMMSLDEAVELVLFAFENGTGGDTFVQKSPAISIGRLAEAVCLYKNCIGHEIKNIGTRHAEKLYETLLTREEMVKAEDLGQYYRVPLDNRNMNYNDYLDAGESKITAEQDFHSHNTKQLTVNEMVALLNNLTELK
ncbi:SDR family NAD(P)-dependent oxidoreductase [Shewanella salipaludis]|uniref:UDP-glucose 4-epimerase n=1 Tax=Shewanella salipaludis TaxID=2723052 RepID=A0A972FUL8_9GAMM|nr:SDR family NAD(P)-dependent oxidoreductase [Shewanella salipaludis]NMH65599.1 polysaccharide biosynthesis protein [Shewanella salipaludis]